MSIYRTGECPVFLKYVTEQALIPRSSEPNQQFIDLTRFNFRWIDIPSFQRGIVWDEDLMETLLASRSVFLGNAVLGSFPIPRDDARFAHLPDGVSQYSVLIDGLQRFSIGTALLNILKPLVFSEMPDRGSDASYFSSLRGHVAPHMSVLVHNEFELTHHVRTAVAESYKHFRSDLKTWIVRQFDEGKAQDLADNVLQLFLQRQIAPDIYHGFSSVYQIVDTFIGLNTVRVQLNIVDWLRSVIVDQGGVAGWTSDEIERIENRFSEIFNQEDGRGPKQELVPLASIIKEILVEGDSFQKEKVFPSWGPEFRPADVERWLNFIEQVWEHESNPIACEIRLCGAIPFAGLILHFYRRQLVEGYSPSFLNGGNLDDAQLLAYLRGYYRVVLDRHVARTRDFARRLLLTEDELSDVADQISKHFLGKALDEQVDRDWLVAALKQSDKKRSRLVFNACLLPDHGEDRPFRPHRYGRAADDYQIDHLIPASVLKKLQPGGAEGDLLMNFAPIRRSTNVRQLNIQCSHKLGAGGVYEMECANNADSHPYVRWLIDNQREYGSQLDLQSLLQTAARPDLAMQRINWITDRLLNRL